MTNDRIASILERAARLIEIQGMSPPEAHAWKDAAAAVRDYPIEISNVVRDHGQVGLEAIVARIFRIAWAAVKRLYVQRAAGIWVAKPAQHLLVPRSRN